MLSDWNRSAAQQMLGLVIPDSKGSIKERKTLTESAFRPLLGAYQNGPRLRYELFNFKVVPWVREGGQFFSRRGLIRMPVHQVGTDRFADEIFTFSLTRDPRGEPRWLHAEYKTLVRTAPSRGRGRPNREAP